MNKKLMIEGFIRAKLNYPVLSEDTYDWYFSNHRIFNFSDEQNSERIKFSIFKDEESAIDYSFTFGHDELEIRFVVKTMSSLTNDDSRISIFKSLINRAINGYRAFKNYFLEKICPDSLELEFGHQNLLLQLHGFLEELDITEQINLIDEMKICLKEYTTDVRFWMIKETLGDFSDKKEIVLLTGKEFEELSRFEFSTIFTIAGEIYLFVDHHLFARFFLLEDPSLSLITVARWGFTCSLMLHDLYFDLADFSSEVKKAEEDRDTLQKQLFPRGIDTQNKNLIQLEKRRASIEDKLREFINMSSKIYNGLNESYFSTYIKDLLQDMRSLPASLDQAYAILKFERLGALSSYKQNIENMFSDLRVIEINNRKKELYFTLGLGILLVLFIILCPFKSEIGYIADALQILTFIVAVLLLKMRFK